MDNKYINLLAKNIFNGSNVDLLSWIAKNTKFSNAYKEYSYMSLSQIKNDFVNGFLKHFSSEDNEISNIKSKFLSIVDEISCNYNENLIRFLGFIFSKFLPRQFSGIYINETSLIKVQSQMGDAPLIFVPTHRSYCDFVLMAFVCFAFNISVPCVAAGIDFHTMKIIGRILNYCKAFFIRRSFSYDEFYKNILCDYVQCLVIKGKSPLEFFIEGKRSRTGKPLSPKFGLLKTMISTFFSRDVPDLIFVPVTLSYDRIVEDVLFCYELLGVPKPKESTTGFIKGLQKMDETYGNVYINFGEPISLRNYLTDDISVKNNVKFIEKFGFEIISRHQGLQAIGTINLIALVLNEEYVRNGWCTIIAPELFSKVQALKDVLMEFNLPILVPGSLDDCINNCLSIHKNFILNKDNMITLKAPSETPVLSSEDFEGAKIEDEIVKLSIPILKLYLYLGPLISHIWIPAVLVVLTRQNNVIKKDSLYQKFLLLKSLFSSEFPSSVVVSSNDAFDEALHTLIKLGILIKTDDDIMMDPNSSVGFSLASSIYSTLVAYECLYYVLTQNHSSSQELVCEQTQIMVQGRIKNKDSFHHASLSVCLTTSAIDSLSKLFVLRREKIGNSTQLNVINLEFLQEVSNVMGSLVGTINSWILDKKSVLKPKL